MHRAFLAAAVVVAVLFPATSAFAATGSEKQVATGKQSVPNLLPPVDPLTPRIYKPAYQTIPPPHFKLSARQAIAASAETDAVREAKRKYPDLKATAYISPLALRQGHFYHWDIYWTSGKDEIVEVEIGPLGGVLQITKKPDIGWPLLLGFPGVLGEKLNAPYVWLPLCLLFLLPFFDPRRPFRLLHVDMLMLLLFGIPQYFFTAGKPGTSVPLVYPFLLYAAIRGLFAAFRPTRRSGPLMPLVSTRFLLFGVAVFVALRIAFGVAGSSTFDVSSAGVIGADRIEHGLPLYQDNDAHGDTYGPVNYLAYIPAELIFPFKPATGSIGSAARATTLLFDLLTLLGLFVLGRRLRAGPAGTRLGAGLAWAWAAFPYSALAIASVTNDALVPLFLVWAFVVIRSPAPRAIVAAVGTMAKFAPGLLAPMLATGRGPFRWRTVLIVAACYLVVCGGLVLAFLPDGGLREFWNTTLGWQLTRVSPLSLWTRHPSLDWLKTVFTVAGVALAVAAAFVPRRRSAGQLAALAAAIFATTQIATGYWIYFYVIWFAPFLWIAWFEEYRDLGPVALAQDSVTSDFVKPDRISQPSSVTATRSSIRTPSTPGR